MHKYIAVFSLTLKVAGEIGKAAGADKWAKIFFEPRSGEQNVLDPSGGGGGGWGHAPPENF